MNHQEISSKLKSLGMNWNHPRVTAFLDDCRKRYSYNFPATRMPEKVANRLFQFLTVYEGIDTSLRNSGSSWDNPELASFFRQHSVVINGKVSNRLTLDDWQVLYMFCDKTYIPF